MKKILLSVLMGLMGLSGLQAQTLVDNYRFTTSVDPTAWIDITGVDSALVPTPTGNNISTSGGGSQLTNIGFTFPFAGTDYTTFGINILGAVRLGARIYGTWDGITLSIASTQPKVDGLGMRGMLDSSCYIRCATVGTVGSRVLVVEARMRIYQHQDISVCWQTQLFEATGEVRLVYGPSTGTADMPATQPGLAKNNGDLLFLNHATHSVVPYTSTPVPTNAAGVWPEQWRCYCFVPDSAACPYAPAVTLLGGTADSTVVGWSGNAAAWRLRIPELGLDTVTADTTLLLRNLNPLATYSGTLQRICGVGDSSLHQRPVSISAPCGTVRVLPWTDDFQLAAGDDCWQKPQTASARRWRRQSSSNNYFMRVPSGSSSTVYNEWLVSPPLVLPDTVGITLGWWYKSSQVSNVAPQVKVRLLVCDTSDDIDTSAAWVTLRTIDHYEQYFQQYYSLLDAWAGHRVRVAFQRVGRGGGYCDVDNVSIEVVTQPSVVLQTPSTAYAGDTTAIVAVLTGGVLANPQYVWHSTMEEQGLMLRTEDDDTLRCVYLGSGTDTVTLTLTTYYGTATATAVIDVVDCRTVTTFPWHEDFEHGFLCWDMPTSGSNVWNLRSSGAHGGQRVACATIHNSYNIYDTLISQSIVVPTDAHGLTLSWWMRHDASADPSGYRRIWVKALNAANPVWSSGDSLFYSTGTPTSWQQFSVDLEPLAGQTVRLAFVSSSYSHYSGKYIYIDDIEIRYTREPIISLAVSASQVYDGDTVTATATLTEGDTAGIVWWMNSRMADMGQADITGSGPQVQIAYHGTGIDTIVASATNAYGSIADTAYVRVCPVQDTLPWVANFVNELPCWQVISGACNVNNNYGYLSFTDWPTAVATLPVYVPDDGNVVVEYSCAYSYFYGSTMVMVTTDMVHFDTIGNEPFTDGTHPSTRIPLGAYAGQYVRVVFKATGEFLQYYLTSVQIRYANEPVVQAEADDGYFPGTPVPLTASLLEGDTVNLTYSWASTMTQRGDATLTFDGGPQATLVPSVGGPDTVTVWATNNHGTDSTTIVVNIKPCATVDSLPWVEDFSNRFTCWWQPAGSQWSPDNTGIMACVINSPTTGDNWLISRAIDLPTLPSAEGEGMQLWWDAAAIYANSHTYSVWITTGDYRDTGSYNSLATYSSTLPTYDNGWNTPRVDLSAYAGQTVHLAFRYQTHYYDVSGIPGILAIDNVRILDTRPPQVAIRPPARCFVDDTVVYRANFIHGVQSGMSYTWQSTMEQQGLADVNFNDSLIYVVYHAAGSDTVSLVASNAYGSDTAWTAMTVKNCPAVTVPWYEDFEVVNPCWSGSWTPDYITYTWLDSTTHVMHSTPNSWYASPWIDLPDTTGLQLMWNKNGNANSFMKIFVSPTGSIEPTDFTDTLLYRETPNGFDSLPLDAYAGRRIRVAFAQLASSNNSDSYVLDDVRVDYNRAAPQVSLTVPLFASSFGDAITATATLGNIAQGVTYSWSSTLGVVTAMGAQCHISYTVAGEDTITVVASNLYGSDTALAVLTVYDCGGMVTVPFFEDFSNITTTTYSVRGWLPPCWNATWNGDNPGLAPHVITTGGYQWMGNILNNALLMQAGTSTGYGPLAEVLLPRFADSLHHLMMAFDYRFESANYGTLVVGYYDDTVFTAVDTLAGHAGNYRRDTVLFDMHFSANNPNIAIRWQYSGGAWFAVAIDNLEVYSISDLTPHATIGGPDTVTAYDTAHFVATLLQGDTIGLTYTWHSSLTGQSATGSHWPVVYTVVGIDTISVTIANLHGSQTLNKTVTVTGAPQVTVAGPTAVDTYDTLVYTASIVDGTSVGLTYTWHSTLMGSLTPYPSPNGEGSSVQLAYTVAGTDTLTVIAANACGADTASLVVEVNYVPQVGSPVVSVQGYQYATLCDTASFTVTLLEGDTTGLIYTWHSAKADRGEATLIPEGDRLKVTYSTIGFDTITVLASNNLGWRSVTATTRVLDCEVRDTPFEATLTDGGGNIYVHFLDWQRGSIAYPRGNLRSNVGWHPVDNSWSITLDGRNCMESHKSDYGDATGDHWLISPPIRLPENTVDTLAWNAYCDYTTYHVLLSPTEYVVQPDGQIDRSYFTDTIYSETGFSGWTRREVDLSAYAGRTIHLAFVHTGPASDATHVSGHLAAIDTVWIWSTVGQDTVPVPPLPDTVWYNVSVVRELNGIIDSIPNDYITGVGRYPEGDTVTLTMLNSGYKCWPTFYGWVLAPGDTVFSDVCQFVITCDTVITAYYVEVVGIAEVETEKLKVEIYPNPTHGDVTIAVTNALTHSHINAFTVSVVDLMGRTVIPPTEINSSLLIPHSTLPSGTYFVRITTDTGTAVRKLIVK